MLQSVHQSDLRKTLISAMAATNVSCPVMGATSNGVFQGDKPIDFALPLLILQICLVLAVTRTLGLILKPLRQPRVIAEIIGGILLGPSALGHSTGYINKIFPNRSIPVLDTVADLGLLFFLFLVGLELDLRSIRRTGKQALFIAAAGISVPFIAGVGVSVVLHNTIASDGKFAPFLVFMGVAMSITAFPVLARILAERKLLTTDVGQMAMSAAAVNDVVAWILLALAVALSGSNKSPLIAIWVLLCGVAYVTVMFTVVKPLVSIMAKQTIENEPVNELYVAITLAGVLASGFVTDSIGIHSIFGAFVFGLIVPKEGPFAQLLIEKIEDFVTILMLPLYFASSGLKTNIGTIHGAQSGGLLVLVITTACVGKIVGTFVVAILHKMDFRKSLTLGFLMNTKGLVELIVLNIGKDRKVLNDETFAIMVLMALFTTFITTPVVMALYKPARNPLPYNRRTLFMASDKSEAELRILACVHGMPNVHAIINLVEASRGTRKRPLHMYILHLLELSERPSSIMKVQRVRRDGRPFWDKQNQDIDNIVVAFEAFGQLSKVTVRPMTAISRFDDMHEDICATAADKRAAIIIMPFHKQARPTDGGWEGHNPGFRSVNLKVLLHAPCSVGILIDRGIGIRSQSSSDVDQNVAVLFFGGPDDREALAFGYRMAEHPGVKLTVFRFVFSENPDHATVTVATGVDQAHNNVRVSLGSRFSMGHETYEFMVTTDSDWAQESKKDEDSLEMVKKKKNYTEASMDEASTSPTTAGGGGGVLSMATRGSILYEERAVNDPIEAALQIGKMEDLSLIVVGRGRRPSPLIAPLAGKHAEFPELGPVGDALTSYGPAIKSSVLVIQQHDPALVQETPPSKVVDISTPKSSGLLAPSLVVVTGPVSPHYPPSPLNAPLSISSP